MNATEHLWWRGSIDSGNGFGAIRWIQRASDVEPCIVADEQNTKLIVIWNSMTLIWCHHDIFSQEWKSDDMAIFYWDRWFAVTSMVNTLRPRQDGRRFPDDTFDSIFLKENVTILIEISLKFIPKGPIYNIQALVQIMAWHWSGNKLLSEPMIVRLPTHVCVTLPHWVNMPIFIFCHFLIMM